MLGKQRMSLRRLRACMPACLDVYFLPKKIMPGVKAVCARDCFLLSALLDHSHSPRLLVHFAHCHTTESTAPSKNLEVMRKFSEQYAKR